MRIISNHWNAQRYYHAALQYSPDTPNHPAPVLRRYQHGLADRRLELCHRHAAVKLAVSGSSSSGIRDHQLALFLGGLFHGSLLSSGCQKIEQSRFVNVDEPLQNLCHSLLMAHECTTLKRANFRFSILNPGDP
jgi:hypothetical protein